MRYEISVMARIHFTSNSSCRAVLIIGMVLKSTEVVAMEAEVKRRGGVTHMGLLGHLNTKMMGPREGTENQGITLVGCCITAYDVYIGANIGKK